MGKKGVCGTGRRRVVFWVAGTVALACLITIVCFLSYPAYRNWQADRAVRLAKESLEKRDFRNAFLSLQNAVRKCPDHVEALGVAAALLETVGQSQALIHRRRLVELQPELLAPRLALARSALRFGQVQVAADVLDTVGPDHQTAEFMELRAELCLARGRADLARDIYRDTVQRHPEDARSRVKLAVIELQSGSEQDRASARATLESMASEADFGLLALRALTQDALRRRQFVAALSWSERLLEQRPAEFSDRMLRLQALFAANPLEGIRWLSEIEKDATGSPRFAFQLAKWKAGATGPQSAVDWLEGQSKAVRDDIPISMLLADCYSALGRWNDLESLVRWSDWRELEPLRVAFLARAQAGQGNSHRSDATWKLAVASVEKRPVLLVPLLEMARVDKRDARQIKWMIAEKDPRNISIRRELYQTCRDERDSEGMLRMMELVLKEKPTDRDARFNVAGLLLVTGHQIARAQRLAEELYEGDPASLENAVLYAFGLHLQGESRRGMDILDSRNDLQELGGHGVAYYALILSACGRNDEARDILAAVERESLLPELQESLDRALGVASASVTQSVHLRQLR
jgi:tetratricopeptide (TPR) repeat protein